MMASTPAATPEGQLRGCPAAASCVDLLVGEESNAGLAFPFSTPVAHLLPYAARSRAGRRRAAVPRPTDWADVFEGQEPVVLPAAHGASRLHALPWDLPYLEAHLPKVLVHTSTKPTVQMMSAVQPLGGESMP